MINYKLFKDNGFGIKSICNKNSVSVISDGIRKYAVKECSNDLNNKLRYLKSRNFINFPDFYILDNYYVFDYIEDSSLSIEERLSEAINIVAILHVKTTRYKKIDIDDYKIIYEDLYKKIEYLQKYYITLNDEIDNEIYMSPSHYLLVLNISKIYSALSFCKKELDNWYDIIKKNDRQRLCLIHNNLDISHVLCNKHTYLISFDKSKIDIPIYDLVSVYKKYYNDISFDILFNIYQSKNSLLDEELMLFFIMVSIPFEVEFTSDEINNVKNVKRLIKYVSNGDKLVRKFYDDKIKK